MAAAASRVLIVDDDAVSRRLLEVRLRALECEVVLAAGAREAIEAIRQELPALMLLDLQMPEMSGMELLRTLRREGVDFPIIVVTAYGSIESAVEAMKEGAYDFIPKPFDPSHLEAVVRKALERERLKRDIAVLVEEAGERYRLVIGKSAKMKEAVDTAKKKRRPAMRPYCCLAKAGQGRKFSRDRSTTGAREDGGLS